MKHRVDPDQLATPMGQAGPHHGHDYFENLRAGLRWKLLVAYVTPLILLTVYFLFQYNATLREGIDNHLRSVAENQRNTVDLFLKERVANLRHLFPADTDLDQVDSAALQAVLTELRREAPTFVDVGVFRPDGRLNAYAGLHPSLLGKDYSGEAWFRQLRAVDGDHVVSDVYLGFRDHPHFIIAVKRLGGEQSWVLRASVDPAEFGRVVASSFLMAEGQSYIVNAAGTRQTLTAVDGACDDPTPPPPRSAETRIAEHSAGGTNHLAAFAWLTECEWALVVSVPTDTAYAPLQRARAVLLGITLLALVLIVAVVMRSTRRMVGRLEATDHAKENLEQHLFNAAKLASVGEMAAGVAHEINNPLAVVYEEAAMMEDLLDPEFAMEFSPEEFRERLAEIKGATMRGREITRKLLAFSRKHEPEPEPTDVNELLERTIEVRRQALEVCNIDVTRSFALDLPQIMVNRNQLEQVFLNLVNNAKDAIGDGGRITMRSRPAGDFVEVDIEDTGSGMTTEVMQQIFFPFFTTKGVGRGTGLGLSISYGIVKACGGRIVVSSEEGVGTTFTLSLPVAEDK